MRTLTQIRDSIRTQFVANPTIQAKYGLNPALPFSAQFSDLSLESVLIDVMTMVCWVMENIFAQHVKEIDEKISTQKPHTLRWYRRKALDFQLGQALVLDQDYYDNTGMTDAQISALKVVKNAAAIEQNDSSGIPVVRLKLAGESAGEFVQLPTPTVVAVKSYFEEIKDAGVKLLVTSDPADSLKATIDVHYNPMILNSNGTAIGGSSEPVRDAVTQYLRSLPFNGEFSTTALTDAIQRATGVVLVSVIACEARYGNLPYLPVITRHVPFAGYLKVYQPSDLQVNYIPYTANQ